MIVKYLIIITKYVLCLTLFSCLSNEKPNHPVINTIFKTANTNMLYFDLALTKHNLKKSLESQLSDQNLENTKHQSVMKVSISKCDTQPIPIQVNHLMTKNIKPPKGCEWYAPLRIHILKDSIEFNGNRISHNTFQYKLNKWNASKMFLEGDFRIGLNWDDDSFIRDRQFILEQIIIKMEDLYSKISLSKFERPIHDLTTDEINQLKKMLPLTLYCSFKEPFKQIKQLHNVDKIGKY